MSIKQCPLNDQYRFKTQCRIDTCKFFSSTTKNRCLGMDIRFSAEDKSFSDYELLRYKFNEQSLTIKDVTKIRKQAISQAKYLIMLHHIIHFVRENYTPFTVEYDPEQHPVFDAVLQRYPLSVDALLFQSWMICYVLDPDIYQDIVGDKFRPKEALQLRSKEFDSLQNSVNTLCAAKNSSSGETHAH